MDRRLKSTKLHYLGVDSFEKLLSAAEGGISEREEAMIYAFAVMIDEALNGAQRAKRSEPKEPLAFQGTEVYEHMKRECPGTFIYEPVDNKWWGQLNRQIRDLKGLPDDALDRLAQYCRTGAYGAWKAKEGLQFEWLVKNFKKWMTSALSSEAPVAQKRSGSVRFIGGKNDRK